MAASIFLAAAQQADRRSISLKDLPESFRRFLTVPFLSEETFAEYRRGIDASSRRRELDGEWEHAVYFALQSNQFTSLPRIEPALSAAAYFNSLSQGDQKNFLEGTYPPTLYSKMPPGVQSRLDAFVDATDRPSPDPRLSFFHELLWKEPKPRRQVKLSFYDRFARAMRFLYLKEFGGEIASESGPVSISRLYQERGYSLDTQIEANFGVRAGLEVIHAQHPEVRLERILVVGPGLDLAPRTDLIDLFPPQTYQPYAVADALIDLKMRRDDNWKIDCIDINQRVVEVISDFPRGHRVLSLISGIADIERHPLTNDYKDYFRSLGKNLGSVAPLTGLPPSYLNRLHKSVTVKKEIADKIQAESLNIITERYDPSPDYDLVIITNVLTYFDPMQLAMAATNISSMMRPGGFLIHNERRKDLMEMTETLGLKLIQFRTTLIASNPKTPLYDNVFVHHQSGRPKTAIGN
ncbi:MAG TPA: CheR family methyltransferase [Acidobacteriota bacterium]